MFIRTIFDNGKTGARRINQLRIGFLHRKAQVKILHNFSLNGNALHKNVWVRPLHVPAKTLRMLSNSLCCMTSSSTHLQNVPLLSSNFYGLLDYQRLNFGTKTGNVSKKGQYMNTLKKLNTSENIWTIPNWLCVARVGMAPVLAYLVLNSQFPYAIGLLAVAGLTDLLDGWIARVVPGQSSVIGSFLDPMADKVLVGTLFLSLTYINLIPVPLTALVLSRDVFLIAAGFYIRYQSLQPPKTFARYFDITSPSAQLAPTFISKVNTGVQLSLIGATLLSTVFPAIEHSHLVFIWYCTGGSTIISALSYVFTKDTYKIIQKTPSPVEPDNDNDKTK